MAATILGPGLAVVVPSPEVVRADPLPAYPTMYATPECFSGTAEHIVTVTGRNFEPNTTLLVAQNDRFFEPNAVAPAVVGAYGTFTTTVSVIPNQFGTGRVDAIISLRISNPIASVYFSGCPTTTIVASPSCGDPLNPEIHVIGAGFGALGAGPIRLELTRNQEPVGEPLVIEPQSSFDETFQPGVELAAGVYTIAATQSSALGEFFWSASDEFAVPCPEAEIEPVCAEQPGAPPERMSIFVTGRGWLARTNDGYDELQVVFDPAGEPQEFFFSANPFEGEIGINPDDGSFGALEINPYARPEGTYTIEVKQQGYRSDPIVSQFLTFTVPCLPPTITVDGDCGPPQLLGDETRRYDLTVTGAEFDPLTPVSVTFDPDGLAGPAFPPETFPADAVERDRTFALEIAPLYRPPGTYRILAVQERRLGRIEASATFTVPCTPPAPTLTIDPPCGAPAAGQPDAYSISVRGTRFVPGPVDLRFNDELPPPGTPPVVAGLRGGFTATLLVTGRGPGTYLIAATQSTILGVYARQEVPFLVPCDAVLLEITPTRGPRGLVPLVEGHNFPAETTLLLRWDRGIGASRTISVVTDQNGTFSRQVVIFRKDFTGMRRLTVELPDNAQAYPDVFVDYYVTRATASPPFRILDNPFAAPDATIILRR